jgi:hypothetical protein
MNRNSIRKLGLPVILTILVSQLIYTGLVFASQPAGKLSSTPGGIAEIVEDPILGTVIHLEAPGEATEEANESRIEIRFTEPFTLNDLDNLSWRVNTTMGYPPHADILLSGDGENVSDVLVCEFAYQPHEGTGYEYVSPGNPYGHYDPDLQDSYYNPPYDEWVQTFQNATGESATSIIDNNTICWLGSGLSGPYNISDPGAYFGKLSDFKEGTVTAIGREEEAGVSGDTMVIGLNIEVDNWMGPSEAYISGIALNGGSSPPSVTVISPASTYQGDVPLEIEAEDLFTNLTITYDVRNKTGHPIYENETYTGPTYIKDLKPGEYTLKVAAESMIGLKTIEYEEFNVTSTGIEVNVTPDTLNLKSKGNWINVKIKLPEDTNTSEFDVEDVKVSIMGEELEPKWYEVGEDVIILKFDRSQVQELAEGSDQLDVTVTGTIDDDPFTETDTIRIINPGNMNRNKNNNQSQNRNKEKNQGHSQNGEGPVNHLHQENGRGPQTHRKNKGRGQAKGRNK